MNIRIAGLGICVLLAGGSLATLASQAAAQTTVFEACYVDKTGVIYLIRLPGLPTECIKPDKHIQFRWVDGQGADHGLLNGLAHNDHPQYLTHAGGMMTDTLGMNGFRIRHLGAGTEPGDAVPFEQAVKNGDVAVGDLEGIYPGPTVASLQGNAVDATPPTEGQLLAWDAGASAWKPTTPNVVFANHGDLGGLGPPADDHPQYLLVNGTRNMTGDLHIRDDRDGIVGLIIENRSYGSSSAERLTFWNEDGSVAGIQVHDDGSVYPGVMSIFNNRPIGSIQLRTQGQPKLTVANDGNVGIGTIAPSHKLTVDGVVKASGGIEFGDGSTLTSAPADVDVVTVSSTVHLTAGWVGEQTLDCPTGFTSASGGWLLVSPGYPAWGDLHGAGSLKVLDSWKWKFHNGSTDTTFDILLEVYCIPKPD